MVPKAPADGGVSTGNVADLDISFSNQPLTSLNNDAFGALFAQVTLKNEADLTLKGTADVTARTTIGDVPISGIPFDVPSSLEGINGFGGSAGLSNVSVTGSGGDSGSEFIVAPLTVTLGNPSNITLQTVDISLPVMFKDVVIGRAALDVNIFSISIFHPLTFCYQTFDLIPGQNIIPAEFHYQPDDANNTVAQVSISHLIEHTAGSNIVFPELLDGIYPNWRQSGTQHTRRL